MRKRSPVYHVPPAMPAHQQESGVSAPILKQDGHPRPHWADKAIAVFTMLTFLTYITSNYFVWKQLTLTQGALNASNDQFRRASRPWVNIEGPIEVIEPLTLDGKTARVAIRYSLKNAGSSPAIGSIISGVIKIESMGELFQHDTPGDLYLSCEPSVITKLSVGHGALILPLGTDSGDWTINAPYVVNRSKERVDVLLLAMINYHDQFGDSHCTSFAQRYEVADHSGFENLQNSEPIPGRFVSTGFGHSR